MPTPFSVNSYFCSCNILQILANLVNKNLKVDVQILYVLDAYSIGSVSLFLAHRHLQF